MKAFVLKYKWKFTGVLLGAVAGLAYWYFIGCTSGTCPIQSHWESSTLYGALIGFVLARGPSKTSKDKNSNKKQVVETINDKDV